MTDTNHAPAAQPVLPALFDLHGRVALVTGGSRGLGLQIAEALGEAGAKVLLTSRKAADLEQAAASLQARGIDAQWIAADASDEAACRDVVGGTLGRFGRVDILVNNAGATWGAPAEEFPLAAWDKVMTLNVRSCFVFAQEAAQRWMLSEGRGGAIVNVASIAALGGNGAGMQTVAYNTSKSALHNMTRTLAAEWGPRGIRVNALAPGFFPSRMTRITLQTFGVERLAASSPLRRLGGDDDLKGAALLLASDAGRHITGQMIAVDGGVSCVIGGLGGEES